MNGPRRLHFAEPGTPEFAEAHRHHWEDGPLLSVKDRRALGLLEPSPERACAPSIHPLREMGRAILAGYRAFRSALRNVFGGDR